MRRFTGSGHGAAECSTRRSEDRSRRRSAGSRARMRPKCVGTMKLVVTRSLSISRNASAASKRGMRTTVAPMSRWVWA